MDPFPVTMYGNLWNAKGDMRYDALIRILEITKKPVGWAYQVWEDLVEKLGSSDNHHRAIAAQLLCRLAKSDPDKRMLTDFPRLLEVTRDEHFVTARHCLQAVWEVGAAGPEQQRLLLDGMAERFDECASEKNFTLIRSDILTGLKQLYWVTQSEIVQETALELISRVDDEKYHKKYSALWRKKL